MPFLTAQPQEDTLIKGIGCSSAKQGPGAWHSQAGGLCFWGG